MITARRALLPLLLAVLPGVAAAQGSAARTTWWGEWGAGITVSDEPLGLTVRAGVAVERNKRLVAARVISSIDIAGILGAAFGSDTGTLAAADYGLLVGRAGGTGVGHRYGALGIGVAEIHRAAAPAAYRVALLLEVEWAARLAPIAGVAAHVYGDLNTVQPFAGITLSVQVGRLR